MRFSMYIGDHGLARDARALSHIMLTRAAFLAFAAALFSSSASAAPPSCSTDGQFPNSDHCGQFYVCSNGVATLNDCPLGLFFNDGKNYFIISRSSQLFVKK